MDGWLPAREVNAKERQRLRQEAQRLAARLAERGAHLVVLFGSVADDDGGPVGDIDLLVVMPTELPFVERAPRLLAELGSNEAIDLLVYTPEEVAAMRERSSLVRHVLSRGAVLHAQPAG